MTTEINYIDCLKTNENTPQSFIDLWIDINNKMVLNRRQWIKHLRQQRIKAAHPDDGWVDRESNSIQLVYPQFNDEISVGDLLALGWPDDYRIVRIISRKESIFGGINLYFVEVKGDEK